MPPSVAHRLDARASALLGTDVARLEAVLWLPLLISEVGATYGLLILYGLGAPGWTTFFLLRAAWLALLVQRLLTTGEAARALARATALLWVISGVAAYLYDPYSRMGEELTPRLLLLVLTWRHGLRGGSVP